MTLTKTMKKPNIPEEEIKKVFKEGPNQDEQPVVPKRKVSLKKTDQVNKTYRPSFDLEETDYNKLRTICGLEGNKIGKTLTKVIKDWLDSIEIGI